MVKININDEIDLNISNSAAIFFIIWKKKLDNLLIQKHNVPL